MIIHDDKRWVCVWQQSPTRRSVQLDGEGRFLLTFPRILFRVHYQKTTEGYYFAALCCGFASLKNNIPKNVYYPLLPNIDDSLNCCLGDDESQIAVSDTLEGLCKSAVGCFWQTPFAAHELDNSIFRNKKIREDNEIKSVAKIFRWWAKQSEDPNWNFPIKSLSKWGKYDDFTAGFYPNMD